MFKIAKSPTLWVKVETGAMTEDGKRVTSSFELKCKRLTVSETRAANEASQGSDFPDYNFLRSVVVDWRGIADDDDSPMTFSEENLLRLCEAGYNADMVRAFYAAMPGAKQKN